MNIVVTMQVSGRGIVQYQLWDQPFVPRTGDEILIISDLTPTPVVTHVQLTSGLGVAYVTLSEVGPIDDAAWQAIHEVLGQGTPASGSRPSTIVHPFARSDGTLSRPPSP